MVDLTFPFPPHLQVEVEEPVAEVEEESAADIKVRIRAARERALAKSGDRGVAFPEAFSFPRACTQRHSALSDLRPSSPPCTDRNRAFRPPLPPDEPSEALLHSLQRVPQVRALHPRAVDASTPTNHTVVVGCRNSANKYLSARSPPLLSIVSGAKRRRARTTKSARSTPSTTALCALLSG